MPRPLTTSSWLPRWQQLGVAGEHLLGSGFQLDQGRGGHQAVQFQQFGPLGRIGHIEAHLEAEVFRLEEVHQAAHVGGGPVVGASHQQQLQLPALRRLQGGAQGRQRAGLPRQGARPIGFGTAAGGESAGLRLGGVWFPCGRHRRGESWRKVGATLWALARCVCPRYDDCDET